MRDASRTLGRVARIEAKINALKNESYARNLQTGSPIPSGKNKVSLLGVVIVNFATSN
jgi:hypothetical protein